MRKTDPLLIHPQRVLVIATRQIGDVLLTTPLIRSLRNGYPEAEIDILVYEKTDGGLQGNTDLNRIIRIPERPDRKTLFGLFKRLFRRYDLTVNVQGTDRASLYGLVASKAHRVGILFSDRKQESWKKWLLDRWVLLDNLHTHTVEQNLQLADCLGLERQTDVIPPNADQSHRILEQCGLSADSEFVVLHPFPRFRYKDWHFQGWVSVIRALLARDIPILLSGGPGQHEKNYCASLVACIEDDRVTNLAGQTSLAELADVISLARAYVGPDTAVTHLAAATGTPTITFFGPSNPEKWGPWPNGFSQTVLTPWKNRQARQSDGNVILLQGEGDCVPCHLEGCDRHRESRSRCLETLNAQRIIDELDRILGR